MKLVIAIIQPNKLDYVTSALRRAGVSGATVTMVRGFGAENALSDWNLSGELTEKVKVEIVLADEAAEEIVNLLQKLSGTGQAGAGFIYVQEVSNSFKHW